MTTYIGESLALLTMPEMKEFFDECKDSEIDCLKDYINLEKLKNIKQQHTGE